MIDKIIQIGIQKTVDINDVKGHKNGEHFTTKICLMGSKGYGISLDTCYF